MIEPLEELINKIHLFGTPIQMTVNTPFLMDDPEKIWFVESGHLNIYTVKLNGHQSAGKRYFFSAVEANQVLMGVNSKNSPHGIGFSADATEDSLLYACSIEDFRALWLDKHLRSQATALLTQWIENIFYGISENANHPNIQAELMVKADERVILRKGESISSQRKVVWAKISSSKLDSVLINGSGHIYPKDTDVLLPVTRRSFLQSDRNVGMKFLHSEEALMQDASWEGLKLLDETILALEKAEIDLLQRQEEERLRDKYENQFRRTNQSLKNAQSILNKDAVHKYASSIESFTEDHLFNACQVVSNYDGIDLDLPDEISKTDPLGDITRASKVRFREILLEDNWWEKDSGALLGFLKESGEPVALMPLPSRGYEVYEPAHNRTFIIDSKTNTLVDKIAFTFYKPFPDKKITVPDLLRFGIFKDYRDFYLLLWMGIGASVLDLVPPIMTGMLFDGVIPNANNFQVLQVGFGLLMAMFGYVLFTLTESYALLRIETKMDHRLQTAVWDRLLNLPVSFFRNYTTGDLAERAMGINEIRHMLSSVVVTSVLGSIFSLLNFLLLFYYSLRLALVAACLVFIEIIIIYLLGRWQIAQEKLSLEYEGKTQGVVLQLLIGISKLRVTGTEIQAFTHWLNHFSKMKQFSYQALRIQNIQSIINSITPLLFSAVIYLVLIESSEFNTITTGEFLAFNAAYGAFMAAMLAMSGSLLTIYRIFPLYNRTRPILETLPETDSGKTNPGKLKGKIEVSQVNFRYEKDSPLVLQDISLKLESGDYVAFVGPSGSGKSTMVRLLLGFDKPESGTIFFDNQELSQLDIRLVRRQIGTVLQDGQLTPGDIFSNIVGSSPHLTMEDAWEAAKLAALDEDIKRMPMGMHTVISEGSSTLSGGQKQRMLIARTLVHKPRIVIFDEATSALDNRTQSIITNSLNKLQATRIVIAHRLSTIKDVDKIFVFDKGRIVQTGTFDELISIDGPFKDLAARQIE